MRVLVVLLIIGIFSLSAMRVSNTTSYQLRLIYGGYNIGILQPSGASWHPVKKGKTLLLGIKDNPNEVVLISEQGNWQIVQDGDGIKVEKMDEVKEGRD